MNDYSKQYCVLVTSRFVEHNILYKILAKFYSNIGVRLEVLYLPEQKDKFEQLLINVPSNLNAIHLDTDIGFNVLPYCDFKNDCVKVSSNCNLIINNYGVLVGFNTEIYGVSYAINKASDSKLNLNKATIIGDNNHVSNVLISCVENNINEIFLLSENYSLNPAYKIAMRKGYNVKPLPIKATNVTNKVLTQSDLVVISTNVTNYFDELNSFKDNSIILSLDIPFMKKLQSFIRRNYYLASPFDFYLYQAFMSLKVIDNSFTNIEFDVFKHKVMNSFL